MKAENLPFADDEFDVATAIEVLEHVPDPEHTVAEMARVAQALLLVSVPREPLWRGLNMARGAYLRDLGNTPGPPQPLVQARASSQLLSRTGRSSRRARRSRGPCCSSALATSTPAPEASGAGSGGYGRGARILSIGIAATGLFTFAYFSRRSATSSTPTTTARSRCCGRSLFVVIIVIYRPVEQLLSRTIAHAPRARPARRPPAARAGDRSSSLRGGFLVVAAGAARPARRRFDGSRALFWILVGAALAYAASYFARGWFAGHQWFGLYGGLVLFESRLALLLPARRRGRASRRGADGGGDRHRSPRRSPRCSSCRGRSPRHGAGERRRARAERRCARAAASRSPSRGSSSPSRRCSTPRC